MVATFLSREPSRPPSVIASPGLRQAFWRLLISPTARLANAATIHPLGEVLRDQGMASQAMCLSGVPGRHTVASKDVHPRSHQFHMGCVHAGPIATQMVDLESRGYEPIGSLPEVSVGPKGASATGYHPVPVMVPEAQKGPASIHVDRIDGLVWDHRTMMAAQEPALLSLDPPSAPDGSRVGALSRLVTPAHAHHVAIIAERLVR